MSGNYNGERDKSVLEAIANAIFMRGERPEIRLEPKNGRVRVYAKQLSEKKPQVKASQTKNDGHPHVGWSGREGLECEWHGVGGHDPRATSCVSHLPRRWASSRLSL